MGKMAILLFALTGTVYAAQLPDAPSASKPKNPKMFWVMTGMYAASIAADGQTTVNVINQGGIESWNSWLYGRRPGHGRFYAASAAMDGAQIWASYKLIRSRKKWMRVTGWTLLAVGIEEHARGAIHNARVLGR